MFTFEQKRLAAAIKKEWESGLSRCENADSCKQEITDFLKSLYTKLGLKEPEVMIYDSPYAMELEMSYYLMNSNIYEQDIINKRFEEYLPHLIRHALTMNEDKNLDEQSWYETGSKMIAGTYDLEISVLEDLRARLNGAFVLPASKVGMMDYPYLAKFDFLLQQKAFYYEDLADYIEGMKKGIFMCIFTKNYCFVSLAATKKTHTLIQFKDGYKVNLKN